jgi:putative hemolysin
MTLASGQFLMTLDSSVMNVSIAQVAKRRRHNGDWDPDCDHAVHVRDGDFD